MVVVVVVVVGGGEIGSTSTGRGQRREELLPRCGHSRGVGMIDVVVDIIIIITTTMVVVGGGGGSHVRWLRWNHRPE